MRKLFFVVLLFVSPVFCWGQGQNNVWHFGWHAGIDFNLGNPVAISSPIYTFEGSASVSDSNGNLLFSTNGDTVYNSIGGIMGNGLFGNTSTTQSALIVPFPGNNSKYYIFTADDFVGSNGICYSIVDMTLNAGLGGLVSFNNQLLTQACEKLTAVQNSNGTEWWVICHAYPMNDFYAYPVTSAGVGSPVITSIGSSISNIWNTVGYLKSSPNGEKLASVRCNGTNDPIELYDFNKTTGTLSNYIPIPCPYESYGVSFSPDNTKLYASMNILNGINLLQFDLNIPGFQNFPFTVMENTSDGICALQIAPDGKIYCAKQFKNFLAVINNPNLSGAACNFVDTAFTLFPGTKCINCLPNFIDSYFASNTCSVNLIAANLSCVNNSNDTIHAGNGYSNYLWNTGDTTEGIAVIIAGNYSVTVTTSTGCSASDSVTVTQIPPLNSSVNSFTDSLNCINGGTGAVEINVSGGTAPYNYQWSNGATTQDLTNLIAGTYTVTVTDSIGCIVSNPPITIVQINDLQLNDSSLSNLHCHDDTNGFINVTVLNGLSPNNYTWSNGATTEDLNNLTAGTYSVTVSDAGGCTASDTVVITAPNQVIASLTIAVDTIFCSVTGGSPSYHYLWTTGATTAFITSATNGTYTVTVSDINNCTALATVTIDAVSTIDGDNNFEIFPNPVNEKLFVLSYPLLVNTIEVIDVLGRTVDLQITDNNKQITIDTRTFSEGVYFIKLVSSSGLTVVKKFVVVH